MQSTVKKLGYIIFLTSTFTPGELVTQHNAATRHEDCFPIMMFLLYKHSTCLPKPGYIFVFLIVFVLILIIYIVDILDVSFFFNYLFL